MTIIEIEIRISEIERTMATKDYTWIKTNPDASKMQRELASLDALLATLTSN